MLYRSVHQMVNGLDPGEFRYRLSIAEDGSVDGTLGVIDRLKKEFPDLIVRSSPRRQGRGSALRQLWSEIDADIYVFSDADLAAGPDALVRVVNEIGHGAQVATGSRYCAGAVVRRPRLRDLVSRAYNQIVRMLFHDNIRDHQCGLKAFSREAKSTLIAKTFEDSWTWDTEVMVVACLSGMRIAEVPVEWEEHRSTRTPLRRLLSDIYLHGRSLIRLRNGLKKRLSQRKDMPAAAAIVHSSGAVVPPGRGSDFSR
jgi:glycosyltransferase AglD